MTHGPKVCGCCGGVDGIEAHHLYSRRDGCPDDLTVWLCHTCHGRAHQLRRRINNTERTKAALARKKAEGAVLGNRTNLPEARARAVASSRAKGAAFARNVLPLIQQARERGAVTYRDIAEALNQRGARTSRGGAWHATTVRNIMLRPVEPV